MTQHDRAEHRDDLRDGFFANQIRTNFRNLSRMIGFDRARETVAVIINSEAERTANVE